MKATKRFINKLFNNQEWQSFQPKNELSKDVSEKMYAFILDGIERSREKEAYRNNFRLKLLYTGKYLTAASIITLVSFGLWFLASSDSEKAINSSTSKLSRPALSHWEEVRNTGLSVSKIQLPDSSVVKLYPNTTIKYAKIFKKNSRSIYLAGKAFFEVKKDPKRPFSVYAGGLKTTALGTAFTINTTESGRRTTVKLHHGKIVVCNSNTPAQLKVYISKPGSGLVYDATTKTASLMPVSVPLKSASDASIIREGGTIILKNIPLSRVIQILKETYQVTITAESSTIANTTYTGTVDPQKETAEEVLKVICVINNLTLYNNGEKEFIIKKHN